MEGGVGGALGRRGGVLQKDDRQQSQGNDPTEGSHADQPLPGFRQKDAGL
uniref:Uncharacterized protein n=1 Tax=Anguilla anguilla TaxID=7936 RepID=A0A0E9UJB7_ANGAN